MTAPALHPSFPTGSITVEKEEESGYGKGPERREKNPKEVRRWER